MLAPSTWPRAGVDRRNSSRAAVAGPVAARIIRRLALTPSNDRGRPVKPHCGGLASLPDGGLRAAWEGWLWAVTPGWEFAWSHPLLVHDEAALHHSPPVALADDTVLVTLTHAVVVIDSGGRLAWRREAPSQLLDDGLAPNVLPDGRAVFTCTLGPVGLVAAESLHEVGVYGYDVPPPAIYDDGSLAIAGYAYRGLIRAGLDGEVRWQHPPRDADLLPTLDRRQVVAVGSINDDISVFVAPDGALIGEYNRAALFAEHPAGGWVARSKEHLARLDERGDLRWQHQLGWRSPWSEAPQPIVDRAGRIYATTPDGIVGLDPTGALLFSLPLAARSLLGLALIADGLLACLADGELLLLADAHP